jgi:hypothetical protein
LFTPATLVPPPPVLDISTEASICNMTEEIASGAGFRVVNPHKSVKMWIDTDNSPIMVQIGNRFKPMLPLDKSGEVFVYP